MRSQKIAFQQNVETQLIKLCDELEQLGDRWIGKTAAQMKSAVVKFGSLTLRQIRLLCDMATKLDVPLSAELKAMNKQAILESLKAQQREDEVQKEVKRIGRLLAKHFQSRCRTKRDRPQAL